VKGYESFGRFVAAIQANGIDLTQGEYTILAPADSAFSKHELGGNAPVTADVLKYHVIPGKKSLASLTSNQPTLQGGTLTASRKFRKNWLDDAIVGGANWPSDKPAGNCIVHTIDTILVPGAYESPTYSQDASELAGSSSDAAAKAAWLAARA